jgi:ribosome-associated heat shock protein Hsp15
MARTPATATGVRIDKWLWAARFFKTRSQAATAVDGGKVQLNGQLCKPGKLLKLGDTISVTKGPLIWQITVVQLAQHRGSADTARALYTEDPDSVSRREQLREQLRIDRAAEPMRMPGLGRPTKKDRRELDRWRRGK